MLEHKSEFPSFLRLNNTPLYTHMQYILFIDSSVNGPLGASSFLLLRMMLLWTCMYRYHLKIYLSILLGLYSKAQLLDHIIILSLTFSRNGQPVFLSGCNILYSYQQQTRILISLHSCQYCQPIFFLFPFCFSFLIDVFRGARWYFTVVCKAISWFQKYLDRHITICKIR